MGINSSSPLSLWNTRLWATGRRLRAGPRAGNGSSPYGVNRANRRRLMAEARRDRGTRQHQDVNETANLPAKPAKRSLLGRVLKMFGRKAR